MRLLSLARAIGVALLVMTQAYCSDSGAGAPNVPSGSVRARIGAAGGRISAPDGTFAVAIPAGALNEETEIAITPVASPPPGAAGPAFELEPSGLTFQMPVQVSFRVTNTTAELQNMRLARHEQQGWRPLGLSSVSLGGAIVFGETTHFSRYSYMTFGCARHDDCSSPEKCLDTGSCGIPCVAGAVDDCPGYANCVEGRCIIEGCSRAGDCTSSHPECIIPPFAGSGTCGGRRCAVDTDNGPSGECAAAGSHDLTCKRSPGSISGACTFLACDEAGSCRSGYSCVFGACVADDAGCECGAPGCRCSVETPGATVDAGIEAGGDASVPCTPTTCPEGCCDSAGFCRPGNTTAQCGVGGAACVGCGAGEGCAGDCRPLCPSDWAPETAVQEGAVGSPCGGNSCACPSGLTCQGASFNRCCAVRGNKNFGEACGSTCDCVSDGVCANIGEGYRCY